MKRYITLWHRESGIVFRKSVSLDDGTIRKDVLIGNHSFECDNNGLINQGIKAVMFK